MGRRTVFSGSNLSLGTGNVLAALHTPALGTGGAITRVTRLEVFQNASTTLAMCRAEMATRNTAGTLTMTSAVPAVVAPVGGAGTGFSGSTAPAGAVGRSGINSSADSGGTYTTLVPFDFANLNGHLWKPDPTEEIIIPPSTLFVVRFVAAPGTTTGWGFSLWLDES